MQNKRVRRIECMHWDFSITKCIDANECVSVYVWFHTLALCPMHPFRLSVIAVTIAISVVRFNRNALYCGPSTFDISEAVETSLIDLNCDGAIKIADLKSNIFRSALKMTIMFHVFFYMAVVVAVAGVVVVVVFLMLLLLCFVLFCFE